MIATPVLDAEFRRRAGLGESSVASDALKSSSSVGPAQFAAP